MQQSSPLERFICALGATCATATLFACVPAVQQLGEPAPVTAAPVDPSRATVQVEPVASSQDILGEWDIVNFDGHEPHRLSGSTRAAFADFGDKGVSLQIECNYSGASGAVRDGRFVSSPGQRFQTEIGCGPEREERDRQLFTFFDRNPSVERLPDGRLLLTAGETQLLLERPAQRRLANLLPPQELLGEWRMVGITHYLEQGGHAGIGLSEVPGRIVFDGIEVGYSRCPQYQIAYRYTEAGVVEKIGGAALPPSATDCEPLTEEPFNPDMPLRWDVMKVLHSDPRLEKVDDDTILMSTDRYGVLLTKAPCESLEQNDDHSMTRVVDCASPR
ncbi:hypothetical protein [Qipengyuania sp. 902]|uniref:hypothetical protein n=1 Tax=Qipengyuania sp. 902 TaxID=3417565 RepID=UPI003EBFA60B